MIFFTKYNWTSVFIFVGIIILAHFFTTSPYNWKNNTISELAAQHYTYRWIMKIGFILFGAILSAGIGYKLSTGNGKWIIELPIFIYGIAILVSGFYSTKPILSEIEYSQTESQIHSYAAQIAGFSFSIGLLICAIVENQMNKKIIHGITFLMVIGLSALFGMLNSNIGIIQRIMYMVSFIWLLYFYNSDI